MILHQNTHAGTVALCREMSSTVSDVVDAVQVGLAVLVVEILHLAGHNVQRAVELGVVEAKGRPAPGQRGREEGVCRRDEGVSGSIIIYYIHM